MFSNIYINMVFDDLGISHAFPVIENFWNNTIEVFYNRQRRHSSIGYQAPLAYDATYLKAA